MTHLPSTRIQGSTILKSLGRLAKNSLTSNPFWERSQILKRKKNAQQTKKAFKANTQKTTRKVKSMAKLLQLYNKKYKRKRKSWPQVDNEGTIA